MDDLIGKQLGHYQLIELIGCGGMAAIYKAYQMTLDRYVALKVTRDLHDARLTERFRREAREVARLQHPNIVPIYDYGEQDDLCYLAMQYIENSYTLSNVPGQALVPAQTLRMGIRVLSALAYVHARGIVHRDIKPSNILMTSESWPMLIDFGIAKRTDDRLNLTVEGAAIGTPAYMAPEQASGNLVDARTDLYALGVVLYELTTGQQPFDADTPIAVLMQHLYQPPPPPRSHNPSLPAALETVLLRALAKDPLERYQTAEHMAAELEYVACQLEQMHRTAQIAEIEKGAQKLSTNRHIAETPARSYTSDPAAIRDDVVASNVPTETTTTPPPQAAMPRRLAHPRAILGGHRRSATWAATLLVAAALLGGGQRVIAEQNRAVPTPIERPTVMVRSATRVPTRTLPASTRTPAETNTPTPTLAPTETNTPTPTLAPTETNTPTPTLAPTKTPAPRHKSTPKPRLRQAAPPTEAPPPLTEPPPPTEAPLPPTEPLPPTIQPDDRSDDSNDSRGNRPKPTTPPRPAEPTTPPRPAEPTTPPRRP